MSGKDKEDIKTKMSKEDIALQQFKNRIRDVMKPHHDDHYLKKWLKARNFDVGKAETMFRESMEYREKMKVDELVETYEEPEVLKKYMPGGFAGYDKEGCPILIEMFGHMDVKGMLYSCRKSDIEKSKLMMGEKMMSMLDSQSEKLGRKIDGMTCILDMDGSGVSLLWGPAMQVIAQMGKVVQDNYPEVIKRTFIVNAPGIFPVLWRMIRPLITEEMARKICILGANYRSELLKDMEASELPAFLGGTMVDEDGNTRCPNRICQGGTIPEKYYKKELTEPDHMRTSHIGRADQLRLKYRVTISGTIFRWEFKTDGFDIGFGLQLESDDPNNKAKPQEVMKTQRVASHIIPEDGFHTCDKTGIYVVIFDNKYSWTRGKKIHYYVEVIPPEDDKVVKDLDSVTWGGNWGLIAEKTEDTFL